MIVFKPSRHRQWSHKYSAGVRCYAVGEALAGQGWIGDAELANQALDKYEAGEIDKWLADLNGQFAIVIVDESVAYLMADKTRTYPILFNNNTRNEVVISDDIGNIPTSSKLDRHSVIEFAAGGRTFGGRTLFVDVETVQAGELVCLDTSEGLDIQRFDYYQYLPTYGSTGNEMELCQQFDTLLNEVFEDTLARYRDRSIVIPLSGGFDSRLIAAMCRRKGMENVICYSYGIAGNDESEVSARVASRLDFDWHYVEYDGRMWKETFADEDFNEYLKFGGSWISLPHINDWPAINALTNSGVIPNDAVIMPGHTGDFITSGHLNYLFDSSDTNHPGDLIEAIIEKYYSRWGRISSSYSEYLKSIILPTQAPESIHGKAKFFERIDWRERQAKYIINSIRVYEFFNLDSYMPLWDQRLVDFWKDIPIKFKLNQYLFRQYLRNYNPSGVFEQVSIERPMHPRKSYRKKNKSWSSLSVLPGLLQLRRIYRMLVLRRNRPLGIDRGFGLEKLVTDLDRKNHESLILKKVLEEIYCVEFEDVVS